LLFSKKIVVAERKRRGQGGVMRTEDHKRSDANHIAWINPMQSNTTHCAMLELMNATEKLHQYLHYSSDRLRPLWGLFLSRFEKTEGGGFMNSLHSPEETTQ